MRNTLASGFSLSGVGLHGGRACRATLAPAPAGSGRQINGTRARVEHLAGDRLATTLATANGPVQTVEHLLAALLGAGVDDVDVRVEGGEVPILDGSAAPWLERIELSAQPGAPEVWSPGPIELVDGARWARITPSPSLRLTVSVDFPRLGAQRFTSDDFGEYAAARTFGDLADADRLRAVGLALGASRDNTLVFSAGRPLDPLRYPDEVARHKCLDLMGDLALLGGRLRAHVEVHRGGHALHHALVRAIRAQP